jgi:hypothetical protein
MGRRCGAGPCIFLKYRCDDCDGGRDNMRRWQTYIPALPLFNIPTVILTPTNVDSVFDIGISIWTCTAYDMRRKKMDGTRKRPVFAAPCSQSSG